MSCNSVIHDELKNMKETICPFCDQQLVDVKYFVRLFQSCCSKQEIINNNGMDVSKNCGIVQYYNYHEEYIDFNENKFKIRKKSVYIRKYHLNNILINICKQNIQLQYSDRLKIFEIFDKINRVIPKLGHNRKRIISIKYMLKQIFDMLKIDYKNIEITKSAMTLKVYDDYWNDIKKLINM